MRETEFGWILPIRRWFGSDPDQPIAQRERVRRRVMRRVLWGCAGIGVLVHLAAAVVVACETISNWGSSQWLIGLASMAAIALSHAFGVLLNGVVLPATIATCLADERAGGAGEMLLLSPIPREAILRGKVWPRIEPLFWATVVQLVFVTAATLLFEVWLYCKPSHDGLPPLGAVTGALAAAAGFVGSVTLSLWAALRYRGPGTATAVAYLLLLAIAVLAYALTIGVFLAVDELVRGPQSDDVAAAVGGIVVCALSVAALFGAWRLWKRCLAQVDEALGRE